MPGPYDPAQNCLGIPELATCLHITERHVRRFVAERRIPFTRSVAASGSSPPRSPPGLTTTRATPNQPAIVAESRRVFDLDTAGRIGMSRC
jgi:hypothetical protein